MWRIRYTLRRRPTIAVIDATGHTLIVRRLVRDHASLESTTSRSRPHRVRISRLRLARRPSMERESGRPCSAMTSRCGSPPTDVWTRRRTVAAR